MEFFLGELIHNYNTETKINILYGKCSTTNNDNFMHKYDKILKSNLK